MRTIETTATVTRQRKLHLQLQLPDDISPGTHRVVVIIESKPLKETVRSPLEFPTDDYGSWPEMLSLSREEMYGDFGR
jgi:hypothetical protein